MPLPLVKPANIVEEGKKEAAAEAKKESQEEGCRGRSRQAVRPRRPQARAFPRPGDGPLSVRNMSAEGRRPRPSPIVRRRTDAVARSHPLGGAAQARTPIGRSARARISAAASCPSREAKPAVAKRTAPARPVAAPRPKPAPGLAPLERRQKKRLARGTADRSAARPARLHPDARRTPHCCSSCAGPRGRALPTCW